MKNTKKLADAFEKNDFGLVDFPTKFSNVQISRLLFGEIMGCSYCFPHGYETTNATILKRQRSWKKYRKQRWKEGRK
jgi:hypothetical protein